MESLEGVPALRQVNIPVFIYVLVRQADSDATLELFRIVGNVKFTLRSVRHSVDLPQHRIEARRVLEYKVIVSVREDILQIFDRAEHGEDLMPEGHHDNTVNGPVTPGDS